MKDNLDINFIALNFKIQNQGGDCHTNSKLIAEELKKLGNNVHVVSGIYINIPNKVIKHSWVEFEDKILETDCRQLNDGVGDLMPYEFCAVLDKKKFEHRYKQREERK